MRLNELSRGTPNQTVIGAYEMGIKLLYKMMNVRMSVYVSMCSEEIK